MLIYYRVFANSVHAPALVSGVSCSRFLPLRVRV